MYNSVTYNSLIRLIMGGDHHRHQSNLSYECNYGYMIIGETVRRCERNKVWTGLQPICRGQIELYTLENNPTMKQHK